MYCVECLATLPCCILCRCYYTMVLRLRRGASELPEELSQDAHGTSFFKNLLHVVFGHTLRNTPKLLWLHPLLDCCHLEIRVYDLFTFVASETSAGPGTSQGPERCLLNGTTPQNKRLSGWISKENRVHTRYFNRDNLIQRIKLLNRYWKTEKPNRKH